MTTKLQSLLDIYDSINYAQCKQVARNTFEVYYKNGIRAIRFHHTDIITFYKDGSFMLNHGGYKTVTTKKRMNHFIRNGFKIFQKDYQWYICYWWQACMRGEHCTWYEFRNGMKFDNDNACAGYAPINDPFHSRGTHKIKRERKTEVDFQTLDVSAVLDTI